MSIHVYFEVPIVILSLSLWVSKLSQIYGAFVADVEVETSMMFFLLQLLLSTLWIICATLTMQWLVLITTCNGFLCQTFIIYFLYKTKQRNHVRHNCEFVKLNSSPYDQLYALDVQHNGADRLTGAAKANLVPSHMCPMGLTH